MSNIIELENCPELNFIENMTLQETEDQMRELYAGYYRELTGRDPEIGDADTVNLLIKAFCAMEYQTMQYADAKGRMEMLKTSTGSALDALAALVGKNLLGRKRIETQALLLAEKARWPGAAQAALCPFDGAFADRGGRRGLWADSSGDHGDRAAGMWP